MATAPKPAAAAPDDPYTQLREMILRERVLPNERLIETEYAERLGTSRGHIRKALARLEQDGLVVIEPFKGARVRRISDVEAIEITEVRCALEVMMVRHAAERATEADKADLRKLQAEAHALLDKSGPVEVGAATRRLRQAMQRASGHATGQHILHSINSQLVRIWFRAILMPGRSAEIVRDLDLVVDAVCEGDAKTAVKAMRTYHEASMSALKRAVALAGNSSDSHLP